MTKDAGKALVGVVGLITMLVLVACTREPPALAGTSWSGFTVAGSALDGLTDMPTGWGCIDLRPGYAHYHCGSGN